MVGLDVKWSDEERTQMELLLAKVLPKWDLEYLLRDAEQNGLEHEVAAAVDARLSSTHYMRLSN
ncbi:MAG: hypothetical protein ACHQTE_02060 [Candidatus Saccharimonadales bacterium]